jgi:hypothetical protein
MRGETVQLELLGGLFSLSYGAGDVNREALPFQKDEPFLLENRSESAGDSTNDPIKMLKELSLLKDQGIIDDNEFRKLKEKLIKDVCDS